QWQTSVNGAYTQTTYNANANGYLCHAETAGGGAFANPHGVVCDNNFNVWTVGTRTQFNIDANTYLGLDVVYQKLETALAGMVANYGNGAETAATGPRDVTDQSAGMVQFRVHRNFYP